MPKRVRPPFRLSIGSATAAYFRAFGQMFHRELRFETRTRWPPKDPVNAVDSGVI